MLVELGPVRYNPRAMMSDSTPTIESCLDWIDQAASDLVLLNPRDLPAMAKYAKECEHQAGEWEQALPDVPVEVLTLVRDVADQVKNVILDRVPDTGEAMTQAGADLESARAQLARLIEPQRRDAVASAPTDSPAAPEPSSTSSDEPVEEESPAAAEMVVDDEILVAYVEQQQMVLPEMEQDILAYENDQDDQHLANLRRKIHTLKGESGAVDALELEQVCHRLEDYLDHPPANLAVDVLFDTLDWIAQAVVAFGKGAKPPDPQALLEKFAAPALSTETEPDPMLTAIEDGIAVAVTPDTVDIGDPELSADFVTEAQEHFEIADENLLILEKTPDDRDAVGAVFRSFHTLKGVAGFLGLTPIGDLAHAAETLLDEVRQGTRLFHGTAVELTFASLDMLKLMMQDLAAALKQGKGLQARKELPGLIDRLHELLEQEDEAAKVATAARQAALETAEPEEEEPIATSAVHAGTQTMKVDAVRIDQLLDTIGELVIIESIVSGDPDIRALNSLSIEKNLALLGKITHSLRDMGMSMRLVPVDPVFKKMARLVRDLSRKSGKKVELTLKGGDTEIDKGMVEKLGDPLVHMIRNSMDHGLESAADRVASGKTPEGHITLHAHHMGGNIHIDIQDDGRGLNREAILERALDRGLIQSPDGMSDQDIYSLIFAAGFSTAKQVTEISGRGVGMDVVKRNIESLRGNVLIRSAPGQGSTFTLVLPLTTAIIDGMLLRVGQETYIMPTLSILESFRPTPAQVHTVAGRGEMVSYREELLPLFRLSNLLDVREAVRAAHEAIVVVVEEYGKQWGLLVDDLLGQQQVVIKSMGDGLGRTAGVVGASILADGRPGLILDVADVIRIARDAQGGHGHAVAAGRA